MSKASLDKADREGIEERRGEEDILKNLSCLEGSNSTTPEVRAFARMRLNDRGPPRSNEEATSVVRSFDEPAEFLAQLDELRERSPIYLEALTAWQRVAFYEDKENDVLRDRLKPQTSQDEFEVSTAQVLSYFKIFRRHINTVSAGTGRLLRLRRSLREGVC